MVIEKGISILICTYNGSERLKPTLEALLGQERTDSIDWEIVLVDNASTDNTGEVANEIMKGCKMPFRLIHESNPGRDNALNKGFQEVRYEFVCNVDDDTWVCKDYVYRAFMNMKDRPDVAICGGQGTGEFETPPPEWLGKYQQSLAIGPQGEHEGYIERPGAILYGACAVYRKSLWNMLKNNGFQFFLSGRKGNKLNSGEDSELSFVWQLAGYRLYYDPEITFKHYMPSGRLTWKYFRKLFKAFGRSDLVMRHYQNASGVFGKTRGFIIDHYFFFLLFTLYEILKYLPGYLRDVIRSKEGSNMILETERRFALVGELITNRKLYRKAKSVIKKTHWTKD